MIAIVVGMLFVVAIAVWVIVQAAYHPIRQGSRVLAPEGERLASGALRLARREPVAPQPIPPDPTEQSTEQPVEQPFQQSSVKQPPRQQGSPLATPASGVWKTIAR